MLKRAYKVPGCSRPAGGLALAAGSMLSLDQPLTLRSLGDFLVGSHNPAINRLC